MAFTCDALVIGAGPCGVAAALQIKRSGFEPQVFEARSVGGLLRNANLVENYPGFPRGIPGPELCRLLEEHVAAAGVEIARETVREAAPVPGGFAVKTERGESASGRVMIMATGTVPVRGALHEPRELVGRRIFYEVADVPEIAPGEPVAVVGGGDAAYDYALTLARRGAAVTILRRGHARCLPLLEARVGARETITVRSGAALLGIESAGEGVLLRVMDDEGVGEMPASFLVVACGRNQEATLLIKMVRNGTLKGCVPPNLFQGGDMMRGHYRQAGIAVGDGLLAAMEAVNYLRREAS